ncbi:MAG TPA: MopE-related protein, partial [Saprospiraceae bacterium]|nr:MopE-related protein [Saprospiraceae bacterium]
YFTYYADADGDGYGKISPDSVLTCSVLPPSGYAANALDCDDSNAAVYPGAPELCDDLDNDCNGFTDDGIPYFTYYADGDGDGYGKISPDSVLTCSVLPPSGYAANALDCDDSNAAVYPGAPELCDNLDNDCNGSTDDGIPYFTYYADADGDGYGSDSLLTCVSLPPVGYVGTGGDCNDINSLVNPGAQEVLDGLDNDCNGLVDDISAVRELTLTWSVQPNPVQDILLIESPHQGSIRFEIFDLRGQHLYSESLNDLHGHHRLDFSPFPSGVYVVRASAPDGTSGAVRVVKE